MSAGLWALTIFCFGGLFAILGYYIRKSVQAGRVTAELWVSLAYLSMSWLEAPYCYIAYAAYHPDLHRLPDGLGPFDMAWGGLPVLAVPAYVAYFMVVGLLARGIANRLLAHRTWNRTKTMLACGFAVGFAFDAIFEQLFIAAGAFSYVRVLPGMALFPGSPNQFPLYISLSLAIQHMFTTYLLGTIDQRGDFPIARWGRRLNVPRYQQAALTLGASIVAMQAVYLAIMTPYAIVKSEGWATTTIDEPPFDDEPLQPL